jgi:hypothetical protein
MYELWLKKIVPFSCKSSFCLSCAKIKLEEWLAKVEYILFDEVDYRHVILTVPEDLRIYFYNCPEKLDKLIKCGIEMLKELMKEIHGEEIKFGYIVVLQTTGGLDERDNWHYIEYIPFDYFHKKWQYFLFEMMKDEFGKKIDTLINDLYNKYPDGIVAHIKMEKVPKKDKLAKYLMKYVGSPPIALSRIIKYNGEKVKYWYKDHRTNKKEVEEVSVMTFIGRMVQHILPKGFKRVRYYGLHATCKAKKVAQKLKEVFNKIVKKAKEIITGKKEKSCFEKYRKRIKEMSGKDPLIFENCGAEMTLLKIYVPEYGVIYDELEKIKSGKYESVEFEEELSQKGGDESSKRKKKIVQLSFW